MAVEAGIQHFVFDFYEDDLAAEWGRIAAIPHTLWLTGDASGELHNVTEGTGDDRVRRNSRSYDTATPLYGCSLMLLQRRNMRPVCRPARLC